MSRKRPRPLERKEKAVRDAGLVVIASEDRYAVRQYFEIFKSTRIQFRVLETPDGASSPEHVLRRLDEYRAEYDIGVGDAFWIVCDCDHWVEPNHVQNLTEVLRQCRQKQIGVALSNPCFDLWLLLHFEDHPTDESLSCKQVAELLRAAVGGYDKTKIYNLPLDDARVRDALRRAMERHPEPAEIPKPLQTAVHRILQTLVEKAIISVGPVRPTPVQAGKKKLRKPRK